MREWLRRGEGRSLEDCFRRWTALGLLALFLCGVVPIRGWGGDTASGSKENPPASVVDPLVSVFGVTRPTEGDLVLLRDGTELAGTVLNETLGLRTAYGQVTLPVARVAAIQANDASSALDVVLTINRNRFSGFLEDDVILLRSPEGDQRLRCERVRRILFGRRASESAGPWVGQLVSMQNGDFFTGTLSGGPFSLVTDSATEQIAVGDVESATFADDGPSRARVVLRDGRVLDGKWTTEDLELDLDLGPRLRLYRDRVATVFGQAASAPAWAGDPTHSAPRPPSALRPRSSVVRPPSSSPPDVAPPAGMVWVPPGTFPLGSPVEEVGRDLDEGPLTEVTLTHGFWMATHEVTQAEYREVMESNPSQFLGDIQRPVENVSWREAMNYCERLNQLRSTPGPLPDGYRYRLPSEAEWEYACRAGTTTRFSHGDDPDGRQLERYGWFSLNSDSSTHPVGKKQPNAWGLFDMHGNVLEWCLDAASGSLPGGRVTNYVALAGGSLRVARGGSWLYGEKFCRSANRDAYGETTRCSDLGFRVVLAPDAASHSSWR